MSMDRRELDRAAPLGWYWEVEYIPGPASRAAGRLYSKETIHNVLTDEGERNLLDTYFRNNNVPPAFFVGLHSGDLSDTSTLANVTEPSQAGYARKTLARNTTDWGAPALDAGDYQTTGLTVVFTSAFTSWTPVNKMFLASQATGAVGAILLEASLQVTRILASEDVLNVTPKAKAQ
jgi:hypothetical protein